MSVGLRPRRAVVVDRTPPARARPRGAPSTESLFVGALVLFGFRLGARPISDNSLFTHLRTGMDMVTSGAVPRADPYSYTAAGRPWVVQSWLPSWTYGWAERLGGLHLVVLEQALLMALLAWLVVRLARAGTALRTALAGVSVMAVGVAYWSPRPLLFGLVAMALTVTVVERRRAPWLLVPVVWVWVSAHGSFPLGLVYLVACGAGSWADGRRLPRHVVRCTAAFVAGLGAAAVNPLGPRLLAFPLAVGDHREVFRSIVEWSSPNFQTAGGIVTLAGLVAVVVALARSRPGWRDVLPASSFGVLGLTAQRNLPVAAVVMAPVMGRALMGSPRAFTERRASLNRIFAVVLIAAGALFLLASLRQPPLDLRDYPVAATDFLAEEGLLRPPHRLVQQDVVGGYLDLRFGRRARVFVDDRYDMFPVGVARDYETLLRARPGALRVLDRWGSDVVLWDRAQPLVEVLRASGRWRQVFGKDGWVVFRLTDGAVQVPRTAPATAGRRARPR